MQQDIQIQDQPLDTQASIHFINHPEAGGNAVFIGTVRAQTKGRRVLRLDFEAYTPMARKEMQKIAATLGQRWEALAVSIHHRVGTLAIGEVAVVIAVATPHRKAAFEACQYAIDTLKETVPIWKKEYFEDGEVWVAAHP